MCGLLSKIFRQVVQKSCRLADASQGIFVQHDGNIFKQGVRINCAELPLQFIMYSFRKNDLVLDFNHLAVVKNRFAGNFAEHLMWQHTDNF